MSVGRSSGDLPEGAVLVSENEAVNHQWRLLMNWTPAKDTWIFRHGISGIGGTSALTAIYINNYFRKKLHLGNFARFSTYLPIAVVPAVMATVFHQQFVSNDIIIQKTACPICVELRAGAFHAAFSIVIPSILAPLGCFSFAMRYYTYNVPSPIHQPKEVFKLWLKLIRPVSNKLFTMALAQAIFAMGITYFEETAVDNIQRTLQHREQHNI